jgi:hypothetical protein
MNCLRYRVLPFAVAVVACSSAPPPATPAPATSVTGGTHGLRIPTATTWAEYFSDNTGSIGVAIIITSAGAANNDCLAALKDATYLELTIPPGAPGARLAAGTYPANAKMYALDADCHDLAPAVTSTTATVTLTSVPDSEVKGTFAASFDDGQEVKGTFDSSQCTIKRGPMEPAGFLCK